MMTFAQTLWFDCGTGKSTPAEAFEIFCRSVKEEDLSRQVDSMSEEMLRAFSQLASSVAFSLSQLELHAFDFDFEKAEKWKRHRLEMIYGAIRQKLDKQASA